MEFVNADRNDPKRDIWAVHPTMAAGAIATMAIAGIALPLEGETWGLVFLLTIPLFAWTGVRAWRQGHRF